MLLIQKFHFNFILNFKTELDILRKVDCLELSNQKPCSTAIPCKAYIGHHFMPAEDKITTQVYNDLNSSDVYEDYRENQSDSWCVL